VYNTKAEPFVIGSITKTEYGVKYSKSAWENHFEFFAMDKQSITVSKDLGYSIGDTILLAPKTN
jgi:hypothetical protein